MTILNYQVFKTVIEAGSFQKAAAVLGLTPSAISHAIASMEKELGFTVLNRNKAGISLTNYGEQILPYINDVLQSEETLRQTIAEISGLKKGRVKIGCFASACSAWMPDVIHAFGEKYPDVSVEILQGSYNEVREWIRNGTVDFGFLSASSANDLPLEILCEDKLVCVVPEDFEKEGDSDTMTIKELAKQHFVVQRESTDADVQKYLKENNLEIHANYYTVDDLSMLSLVEAGLGVCILPELVLRDYPFRIKCYNLSPASKRQIGLAAHNGKYMAPAVRTLYDYVVQSFRDRKGRQHD